jgi:hypothetical protein
MPESDKTTNGLVWATGFWWLTMWILLGGRISGRKLFLAACATGVLYVAMEVRPGTGPARQGDAHSPRAAIVG